MWYKAPNERLINLNLVTSIDKGGESDKAYLVFYKQLVNSFDSPLYTKVEFPNSQARDMEYNKILGALKLNKVGVIV